LNNVEVTERRNNNLMIKDTLFLSKEYNFLNHYVKKQRKAISNSLEAKEILDFNIEHRK